MTPDKLVKECSALPPCNIIKPDSQGDSVLVPEWLFHEWVSWDTGGEDALYDAILEAIIDTRRVLVKAVCKQGFLK